MKGKVDNNFYRQGQKIKGSLSMSQEYKNKKEGYR
jgi:hypothetical protein